MGRLIPAGTGLAHHEDRRRRKQEQAQQDSDIEELAILENLTEEAEAETAEAAQG